MEHAHLVEHIDFSFNEITQLSMPHLCELIGKAKNLKTLNLQYNDIGVEGGKALVEALGSNNTSSQNQL